MQILFVHNYPTRFVRIDLALLREKYHLLEWYQRRRLVNVPSLASAIRDSDLIFGWFAGPHTLIPVLLAKAVRRPSILVVGGYDTANVPDIGYGSQRGGIRCRVARAAARSATALITNSNFARDEVITNVGVNPALVTVIYHGVEDAGFVEDGAREKIAITVGNVDHSSLKRKGLEAFVRAAAELPGLAFVLVGAWRDGSINYLRSIAPSNVRFTGQVSDLQLHDYLARACIYVQVSRHEAFGLAVAEAMLAECVPVVTRAGALPEVVGEAGVYVESQEPAAVANGIRQALQLDVSWGKRARERVMREFPLSRRRDRLYAVIEKTLGEHGRTPAS